MSDQVLLGVIAVGIGAFVGLILFVPFVALSYRRRGRLSAGRLVLWTGSLVYFWAIWTYTLLPLPDPDTIRCAGVNLNLLQFVDDIREAFTGPGNPLLNSGILQLGLNVVLFVPLGFFLRVLVGRGILVAGLVGLGISLVIEFTQLTGVWGLYPCAYRVFDVDDLLTNTLGALAGSLIALLVPRRHRGMPQLDTADDPRPVTRARRALSMLCDLLAITCAEGAVALTTQLGLHVLGFDEIVHDGTAASLTGSITALAIWFIAVMTTGGTIGDLSVQLRYVGGRLPRPLARLLRFVGGIGGYALLGMIPGGSWLAWLFGLAGVVLFFATARGRGLPGVISGQRLVDARSLRAEAVHPA
ncbi:VanZ family protein [Microbacterium horticulturae]|uniref:VanZ family protein n=1 Tax=Microbacterium horticulturae TaxID=3028316 RepID=A0ABY8BYV3_9MICO|nr:VanZ family protein [Microbacterium sp. KACC 23027]WEG09057.1 VanZ family protein [Microbacterium sp. KACC 23027]